MKPIILASTSPRRKELFAKLGLKFRAVDSSFEEDMSTPVSPARLAVMLSQGKAEAVAKRYRNHLIVAADTFVTLNNALLGKPRSPKEATAMLRRISGKRAAIVTGYTILDSGTKKRVSKVVQTRVKIRPLSPREIREYVRTGEPLDKAGAFAIQGLGAVIIKDVRGDFYGAVGLPLFHLAQSLKKFGIRVL